MGFALILLHGPSVEASDFQASNIQLADVFTLIPLQGIPIQDEMTIREISLLDF